MIANINTLLPSSNKYIIAVIGDANAGKTTTINKVYRNVLKNYLKFPVPPLQNPAIDFSLVLPLPSYLLGIVSRGDVRSTLFDDLERLVKQNCNVILCACRKYYPQTYTAVAEISWIYGFQIIWIDLTCPANIALDTYTDTIANQIASAL